MLDKRFESTIHFKNTIVVVSRVGWIDDSLTLNVRDFVQRRQSELHTP